MDVQLSPRTLACVPLDAVGHIFSYLTALDQGRLRSTCQRHVESFDLAVKNEDYIGCALNDAAPLPEDLGVDRGWYPASLVPIHNPLRSCHAASIQVNLSLALYPRVVTDNLSPNMRVMFSEVGAAQNLLRNTNFVAVTLFGKSVVTIAFYILHMCNNLRTLVVHLPQLTEVGAFFASDCSSLTNLVLGLPRLETIRSNFVSECRSLVEIAVPSSTDLSLRNLSTIGDNFCSGCFSLVEVPLSSLRSLKSVGSNWFRKCSALKFFDTTDLVSLTTVGDGWLEGALSLGCFGSVALNSRGLEALVSVGPHWLSNAPSLLTFHGQPLRSLKAIGRNFLFNAGTLIEFHTSAAINCASFTGTTIEGTTLSSIEKIAKHAESNAQLVMRRRNMSRFCQSVPCDSHPLQQESTLDN